MRSLKLFSIAVVAGAMFLSGCEKIKDFGDTNVNPNSTTVPTTAALLTNVLAGIGGRASQQNPGFYCQYFSETQYPTVSLYSLPQFDFDGIYAGPLYDLQNLILHCQNPQTLIQASLNGSPKNQIAIARIIKCYYFWTITDAWGDIPYSEALNADPFTLEFTTRFPKYDTQEEVYKGLIAELTNVVDDFDNGDAVKGDIIYKGNIDQWKKLANSLRLLMAVRLSKKYPGAGDYAAEQFKLALTHDAGVIEDNADNFQVIYPGASFKNPWFGTYESRNDVGESLPFVELLSDLNDPRQGLGVYGSSNNGVPYGRDRASFMNAWFANNSTTYAKVLGAAYRDETSPVSMVHAAAVFFARAEARERNWTNGLTETLSANDLYLQAIAASFDQWGISDALNGYLSNPAVAYGTDNLKKIALQRFIALYPDGLQGWCEWRRTGVPELDPAKNAINVTKEIPRRFVYGVNDYTTNRENVTAAAAAIPGDTQDGKVWWDK